MRILHTADLHLGTRQYGLAEREEDFKQIARKVLSSARQVGADIVTLGGDNLDCVKPHGSAVEALKKAVDSAGVPVFGIDGNHDPSDGAWLRLCGITPLEQWSGVESQPRPVPYIQDDVSIFGLNYAPYNKTIEKLEYIAKAGVGIDVMLMHAPLGDMFGNNLGFIQLTAGEIAKYLNKVGTRVVLLGDIHDYREVEIDGIRFVYPGSPEISSSSERTDKSFTVVDINGGEYKTEIHSVAPRMFERRRVDTVEDLDNLADFIRDNPVNPVLLVDYNPDLENAYGRIEAILQGRAMFRIAAISDDTDRDVSAVVAAIGSDIDRSGTMKYLQQVLDDPEASGNLSATEKDVLKQLLLDPDNIQPVLRKYLSETFKL